MTGEFYRRLVAHGPELISHSRFYAAVKVAIEEAGKELTFNGKLKPEHQLEYLKRTIEKWFGNSTFQKASILENELPKPPCYGEAFTQPECRQCYWLQGCCTLPDCFGIPFPTDEAIPMCQLCPDLDACCRQVIGMEAGI